jgi:cell division protein FtsQ
VLISLAPMSPTPTPTPTSVPPPTPPVAPARTNRSKRADASAASVAPERETCAPDDPPVKKRSRAHAKAAAKPSRKEQLRALGMKLRHALSVLSAVAIFVGLGWAAREGHRWLRTTARFNARDITVTGLGRTPREDVLRAVGLDVPRNVLSVDCERAARAIEGLPWVSRATVTRRLPGVVTIGVEERSPAAIVAAGSMYLVAADGSVFKRAMPGDPSDLPVITGVPRDTFEQDPAGAREEVRDALALLADVEASAVGTALRIEEVHREGTGDLSVVVGGTHVWLGRGPYRAKLTRLRVVLRELERRGLRASEIHLETDRNPERVTVRLNAGA